MAVPVLNFGYSIFAAGNIHICVVIELKIIMSKEVKSSLTYLPTRALLIPFDPEIFGSIHQAPPFVCGLFDRFWHRP